ncbi:hypothetical protein F5B18DRAFT_225409 [Nemania serpens]|nr:hypothetical protein F5B18DRAFT_225409 [Nemania serpens]
MARRWTDSLCWTIFYLVLGYTILLPSFEGWRPVVIEIVDMANGWFAWTPRATPILSEKIANPRTAYVFDRLFHTAWSRLCDAIWELVHCYFINGWRFLYHMLDNGISLCTKLHVMHIFHQMITTSAALCILVTVITVFLGNRSPAEPASNESRPIRELHVGGSHEEQHIYSLVWEIVNNCSAHWYNDGGGHRYQLEEGAAPEEIQSLDSLLDVTLPKQHKAFLQLTNGLSNVLDGSVEHIHFMSAADILNWEREIYWSHHGGRQETQELWATWLIESMLGPGTREELTGQVTDHQIPKSRIRLIRIASCGTGSNGVFLVPPEDCREIAQGWIRPAFGDSGRCGSLIGRIEAHGEMYFGGTGRRLATLRRCEEWVVLQVMGRRYRLYPSFTAYLETLVEITQRTPDELLVSGVRESRYADHCRGKWEQKWTRRPPHARGRG